MIRHLFCPKTRRAICDHREYDGPRPASWEICTRCQEITKQMDVCPECGEDPTVVTVTKPDAGQIDIDIVINTDEIKNATN